MKLYRSNIPKEGHGHKTKIVYVKNTKEVMVLDVDSADEKWVGKATNQILAIHVYDTRVTALDQEVLRRDGIEVQHVLDEESKQEFNDLEANGDGTNHPETSNVDFRIVAIDSKGKIYLFVSENGVDTKHMFELTKAIGFPEELVKKDLFSMGYPYLITAYYNMIAFSTDYGVFLLKVDENLLSQIS